MFMGFKKHSKDICPHEVINTTFPRCRVHSLAPLFFLHFLGQ